MTVDLVPISRFDTEAFAPRDRHDAWANQHWPAIGPVFEAVPEGPFSNRAARFALGNITVHCSTMSAQRYERTAADARRDGFDQLLVPITMSGAQNGDAAGRSLRCVRGGLSFADLAQPTRHLSTPSRTIMLTLPRAMAERNGHRVRDLHGLTVAAADAALLRRHVEGVARMLPRLTTTQATMFERITADLIETTLSVAGIGKPASAPARETARLMAARALIADSLASPLLSVGFLSRRLNMSRSTLYRLFDDEGGVQAYIRRQRLLRVRDGLGRTARIADLADHWGFSDAAHLSRQFRREFGVSPSDYREAHAADE